MRVSKTKSDFRRGFGDGFAIGLGYLSVSFAFGIFSVERGLRVWQAVLMSMTNLTSAGQLSGVTLICAGAAASEIALSQLVINIRYSLMSVVLSQKFDASIGTGLRLLFSFTVTDEIFAVASSQDSVGKRYMQGLVLLPYLGWSTGTLCGALMGNVLPGAVVNALGIAIYGMFIAIIVPEAKKTLSVLGVVAVSGGLNCLVRYTFLSEYISSGFSIIFSALFAAGLFALICPTDTREGILDEH